MTDASMLSGAGDRYRRTAPALRLRIDTKKANERAPINREREGLHDEYGIEDENSPSNAATDANTPASDTPVTPFSSTPGRKKFPSELKTIPCTYEGCPKLFNRPARLTAHLRSHTNERPFVCQHQGCDKAYFEDKHLQHHIKGSHTTHARDYTCGWEGCGKGFLTATRLNRHMQSHEGQEKFRCTGYSDCDKTFRKHSTLQRHIRSYHLSLAPFPCTYVDPVTNVACNAGYDGITGLRHHQERAHGTPAFFCQECFAPDTFNPDGSPACLGFNSKFKLEAHIKKDHANCVFCDRKFNSHAELRQHIDGQHSGKTMEEKKTHVCTYLGCEKAFTTASNLTNHVRTAHLGQRFICGTFDLSGHVDVPGFTLYFGCGAELTSKQTLIDHTRTAHLNLPSIVNMKRARPAKSADHDTDDEDGNVLSKKPRKRNKKKANAIDELVGNTQIAEGRHISCPMAGCPHLFFREYDLQVHLQSRVHNPPPEHGHRQVYHTEDENLPLDPALMDPGISDAASMGAYGSLNGLGESMWELERPAPGFEGYWHGGQDDEAEAYEWE